MNHQLLRTILPLLVVALAIPIILPTLTTTSPPTPTTHQSSTQSPIGTAVVITAALAGGLVYVRTRSRETFTKLVVGGLVLAQQFILITAPIALALSMWMGWVGIWNCASSSCTISRGWAQPMFLYLFGYAAVSIVAAAMIDRKINQPLASR